MPNLNKFISHKFPKLSISWNSNSAHLPKIHPPNFQKLRQSRSTCFSPIRCLTFSQGLEAQRSRALTPCKPVKKAIGLTPKLFPTPTSDIPTPSTDTLHHPRACLDAEVNLPRGLSVDNTDNARSGDSAQLLEWGVDEWCRQLGHSL